MTIATSPLLNRPPRSLAEAEAGAPPKPTLLELWAEYHQVRATRWRLQKRGVRSQRDRETLRWFNSEWLRIGRAIADITGEWPT